MRHGCLVSSLAPPPLICTAWRRRAPPGTHRSIDDRPDHLLSLTHPYPFGLCRRSIACRRLPSLRTLARPWPLDFCFRQRQSGFQLSGTNHRIYSSLIRHEFDPPSPKHVSEMVAPDAPPSFSVRRGEPELVAPAKQTPREQKPLSDIDDQAGLRFHVPVMMVYGSHPSMGGKDPAKVFKQALAAALVYYYPLAGRLLEEPGRKLVVDCSGEGVLYVEADADITLEEALGDDIVSSPELLAGFLCDDLPGILGCPMISFQVTRLTCGGFIVASCLLHVICDGIGFSQFLQAIAEIARGAQAPSVVPTWHREALNARNPPRVTCTHHEYEEDEVVDTDNPQKYWARDDIVRRFFFFGPKELQGLRAKLPPHLRASTFEIITACLWRCRTAALERPPGAAVRIAYCVNVRHKRLLEVPPGYYGNAFVYPATSTTVESLCQSSLEHTIKVVKQVKAQVHENYVRSVADLMVIKGRPSHTMATQFILSDNTKIGFEELDFGWGYPLYSGAARAVDFLSFFVRFKNRKGENGVVVSIALDETAMEKFDKELKKLIQ